MKGIIFSEHNFHLTVNGVKTQTRRVIKPQPDVRGLRTTNVPFEDWHGREVKPRYKAGETVYLKEPYCLFDEEYYLCLYRYLPKEEWLSDKDHSDIVAGLDKLKKWKNPIFMPESAARYFIKITNVRAERLQDISEEDCLKEGIKVGKCGNESNWMKAFYCPDDNQPYITAKDAYEAEFNMINGKDSWEQNPWVWVYDYEILK